MFFHPLALSNTSSSLSHPAHNSPPRHVSREIRDAFCTVLLVLSNDTTFYIEKFYDAARREVELLFLQQPWTYLGAVDGTLAQLVSQRRRHRRVVVFCEFRCVPQHRQ